MKVAEEIGFGGFAILFMCAAVTYCLLLVVFKPFNYNWGIAWVGIILGTIDLIVLLFIYISGILYKERALKEQKNRKVGFRRFVRTKLKMINDLISYYYSVLYWSLPYIIFGECLLIMGLCLFPLLIYKYIFYGMGSIFCCLGISFLIISCSTRPTKL